MSPVIFLMLQLYRGSLHIKVTRLRDIIKEKTDECNFRLHGDDALQLDYDYFWLMEERWVTFW